MTQPPHVTLVVVRPDDAALREQVLSLAPAPDQEEFAQTSATTLPAADADPDRTPFAVTVAGRAVGFGVIDRRGYLAEIVDDVERVVLLRAFYLDLGAQGRGWGTEAARLVPRLAADLHPDAELVLLTVNERNGPALVAYARAGFRDTGTRYLGGDAGPQHVMVAALPRG